MEMLSNGILDIEDTEGEEISLTAEAPQLTEEEKLRIESEDEEDGEKRIDLFASEDGEADPLNKLLMAEDGISTLFMKKGGRINFDSGGSALQKLKQEIVESMKPYAPGVPESKLQIIVKDINLGMTTEEAQASAVSNFQKLFGMADGGRVSFRGGGQDASSDDFGGSSDQGETSSDSGFSGGNNNNNNNNNDNQGSDQGHSRFDVGSGYYGETVTNKGGSGDTITNTPEVFYDDEITRKSPIERVKTNYTDRKNKFVKTQRKDALMLMAKTAFFGIGPYGVYDFAKKQNQKKTDYINSVKKDIEKLKELGIPEYNPHTDTLIQTLEQDILDLTQPKDKEEKKDDSDTPVTELIAASTETIEDRDETDIFDVWDRIKAGQAKRAMLVEKDIIQDNEPLPITKESVSSQLLNNGGLANLFRVKTQ